MYDVGVEHISGVQLINLIAGCPQVDGHIECITCDSSSLLHASSTPRNPGERYGFWDFDDAFRSGAYDIPGSNGPAHSQVEAPSVN